MVEKLLYSFRGLECNSLFAKARVEANVPKMFQVWSPWQVLQSQPSIPKPITDLCESPPSRTLGGGS